jgi:Xaa-Pro aminopeptidase
MTEVNARITPGPAAATGHLPAMDVPGRLRRLRTAMSEQGCEALLISNLVNVRYLSGFSGSAGVLVVRADDVVLVTDGRYGTQAPGELEAAGAPVEVEVTPASGQGEVLARLVGGAHRLGLEAEHISWGRQRQFVRTWAGGVELVATEGLVEGLRQRKDAGELARIATAARIADQALESVRGLLDTKSTGTKSTGTGSTGTGSSGSGSTGSGSTEAGLALALDTEMRRLGASAPAFETIVAAGPNGAEPHHHPSSRPIERGDLVVVDFGARFDGYCSDMTRCLWAGDGPGRAPARLATVLSVVLAAQEAGVGAVGDGVPAADVDRACRRVVEEAGMGEYFVHSTGHGVGLDIHEAPWARAASGDILCSGQVVTVEPGVYIPGLGGARIEDTVVVTGSGCEVLTLTPKQA